MTAIPSLFPDLAPDPPQGRPDEVLACADWATNAHLLTDLALLGYIRPEHRVCDVTYGLGGWWQRWRPADLTTHDLDPTKGDGIDFRNLPEADETYDVVAFDPPYINPTPNSTTDEFADRYGISGDRLSFTELLQLMTDGLAECRRVLRPGGHLLVKAMAYTNGGTFRPVPALLTAWAEPRGLDLVDEFVMRRNPGPLSKPTTGTRSRRNCSTLLVFRRRALAARSGQATFAEMTRTGGPMSRCTECAAAVIGEKGEG